LTQAWLNQRERGSILAIRLLVGVARLLGRRVARVVLAPVCLYFVLFSAESRSASRKYLSRVLRRPPTFREQFRHYYSFAAVALDRVFLLTGQIGLFSSSVHGEEHLAQVLARGQGCLLLGAHLGSFEILRAFGISNHISVGLLMYEDNARMVNSVVKAINPAAAENIISLGRFDSMLRVQERLQQHDWVGMLGDRALESEAQLKAPFLGEEASFSTAPFRLALMLKRPVILMLGLYRGGNRYELHFEKLFDPEGVDRANRDRAIADAVRAYAARLEHYCREAPFNWFNFYDFWSGPARAG